MAEGFARAYGSDLFTAESAGLAPAMGVAPLTREVMLEKNIDIEEAFPKSLERLSPGEASLIVNMSGRPLPESVRVEVETWDVRDPIGESEEVFRDVRDQIEQRVMRLILKMRARKPAAAAETPRVDTRLRTPRQ
jgi:arsenate reductase